VPETLARYAQVRGLPPRVARFQLKALKLARKLGDEFAWQSATRPADVKEILRLAAGRRRVAELGTATGWTAASLVLADPLRTVVTFDPVVQEHRDEYMALLEDSDRERIRFLQMPGAEGPAYLEHKPEFLFIDSTHERAGTVAEVRAWEPHLARDALVVLHDYGNPAFPGVAEAVADLKLEGDARGGCFVTRFGSARSAQRRTG
jgi:predicted O-methyltransferase YrrM